jgi:hypothetical protein
VPQDEKRRRPANQTWDIWSCRIRRRISRRACDAILQSRVLRWVRLSGRNRRILVTAGTKIRGPLKATTALRTQSSSAASAENPSPSEGVDIQNRGRQRSNRRATIRRGPVSGGRSSVSGGRHLTTRPWQATASGRVASPCSGARSAPAGSKSSASRSSTRRVSTNASPMFFTSPTLRRRPRRITSTPAGSAGRGTVESLSSTIVLTGTSCAARLSSASSSRPESRSQYGTMTVRLPHPCRAASSLPGPVEGRFGRWIGTCLQRLRNFFTLAAIPAGSRPCLA